MGALPGDFFEEAASGAWAGAAAGVDLTVGFALAAGWPLVGVVGFALVEGFALLAGFATVGVEADAFAAVERAAGCPAGLAPSLAGIRPCCAR